MRDVRPESVPAGGAPRIRVGLLSGRSDFFGGGQRSLRELAMALRDGPIEPVVFLPGPGALSDALTDARLPWIPLNLPPLRALTLPRIPRALARLVRETRERQLNLLHSDGPRTALYAGIAARLTGRRHVWHLRAARPAPRLPDRLLLRLCDAVFAVSHAAARRSRPLQETGRAIVIPTGLPAIDFYDRAAARIELDLPQDRLVVGFVGRLERDKGIIEAIAAMRAIRRTAPGAILALLGPVDRNDPDAREFLAAAGEDRGIRLIGPRPEAAPLLPAFDFLLHPSRHEALPRVLIESQHAGVPAVATDVGGTREVIEPGVTGLLVPSHDPSALGTSAAALAGDPDRRRRLADAGRVRAAERFSIDRMTAAIIAGYRDILAPRHDAASPLREVA